MIFLSHTHSDKPLVDDIAARLAARYGRDAVFYDAWSIQPGDGIIDRINTGLDAATTFFFFAGRESVDRAMVKLEWQNALYQHARGKLRFVPVRVDNVPMPAVLVQTRYIDMFTHGVDAAVSEMVDVIDGRQVGAEREAHRFENLRAYITRGADRITIEFRAERLAEHNPRLFVLTSEQEEPENDASPGELFGTKFFRDVATVNGASANGMMFEAHRSLVPGRPFVVWLRRRDGKPFTILAIVKYRARSRSAIGGGQLAMNPPLLTLKAGLQ